MSLKPQAQQWEKEATSPQSSLKVMYNEGWKEEANKQNKRERLASNTSGACRTILFFAHESEATNSDGEITAMEGRSRACHSKLWVGVNLWLFWIRLKMRGGNRLKMFR